MQPDLEWTRYAADLTGPGFALFQRELTRFNHRRLEPSLAPTSRADFRREWEVLEAEREFVEAVRREIASLVAEIPDTADAFIAWFERLRAHGPGQGDPLFPWLADNAVESAPVLPAAAVVEIALATARARVPNATSLEVSDLEIRRPVVLEPEQTSELQTTLGRDEGTFELASRPRLARNFPEVVANWISNSVSISPVSRAV